MSAEPVTFVFADIAGFTALTEAHGDEDAAELAAAFCRTVKAELPDYGGEHIKTIGDALLLKIPRPGDAVRLSLRITHEIMRAHGSPAVRVGLHHGPAVFRDGEYFGAAVNLAARVSGVASGGEVLLTAHTAELAGEVEGVRFESRGRHALRNLTEPVDLCSALREGAPAEGGLVLDPVCRMAVDPERAAGRLTYEGEVFFFCSLSCAEQFAGRPAAYAAGSSQR